MKTFITETRHNKELFECDYTKKAIYRDSIVKCIDKLINNSSFEELESIFNITKEDISNDVIKIEIKLNVTLNYENKRKY